MKLLLLHWSPLEPLFLSSSLESELCSGRTWRVEGGSILNNERELLQIDLWNDSTMIVVGISLVVDELRKGQRLVFRYRIPPIIVASLVHSKRQKDTILSFISTALFPSVSIVMKISRGYTIFLYQHTSRARNPQVSPRVPFAHTQSICKAIST